MSDFNSSLPVRTQNNGDIVVEIVDGTTPTQKLAVDSNGKITTKLDDASGNGITSTLVSTHQALDVNITNTITTIAQVQDESTFTYGTGYETVVGGVYNSTITQLTSGQTGALSVTPYRDLRVNLRTSAGAELGNSATDKLFVQPTDGTNLQAYTAAGEAKVDLTSSAAFGSPTGGTAGTSSQLTGGIYNSAAPTLTTGQQASLQLDSSGYLLVDGSKVTQPVSGTVTANQGGAPWSQNITQVGGTVVSATNSLPVQLSSGSAFISSTNPLPVIVDPAGNGTPKNYYTDSSAVAVGSSATQSTTVGGTTGFYLQQIYCAASGKFKAVVQVETGAATNVFNIIFATFNSTANPSATITLPSATLVPTGARVQVIMTNNDLAAQDLYSTVSGYQI